MVHCHLLVSVPPKPNCCALVQSSPFPQLSDVTPPLHPCLAPCDKQSASSYTDSCNVAHHLSCATWHLEASLAMAVKQAVQPQSCLPYQLHAAQQQVVPSPCRCSVQETVVDAEGATTYHKAQGLGSACVDKLNHTTTCHVDANRSTTIPACKQHDSTNVLCAHQRVHSSSQCCCLLLC